MNYLAHAYLSFNRPEILIGNLISDFVKGKTKFTYPRGIQKGIMLHRAIDEFTDAHPATKKAKEFFRPAYRLYSGAFIDIVYDHFLALDTNEFDNYSTLKNFAAETYNTLEENFSVLPLPFQSILPHMKHHNWLLNYQYTAGIERSFGGLVRRAAYLKESDTAFAIFIDNYTELKQCYDIFFPSLKKFASHYLSELLLAE
jgi:acyl carrier protein phosphodiesterase